MSSLLRGERPRRKDATCHRLRAATGRQRSQNVPHPDRMALLGPQQLADSDPTLGVLPAHTRAHPCVDCPASGGTLFVQRGGRPSLSRHRGTKKEPVAAP